MKNQKFINRLGFAWAGSATNLRVLDHSSSAVAVHFWLIIVTPFFIAVHERAQLLEDLHQRFDQQSKHLNTESG